MQAFAAGQISAENMERHFDAAVADTISRQEEAGDTLLTDGEQAKPSFVTYPLSGLTNLAGHGVVIPFADGHTRQLPCLTSGPFRYGIYAGSYLPRARKHTGQALKQAVISASALSLLYPAQEIDGYSRDQFINDLIEGAVADIRSCFDQGAAKVQNDFTEARLAIKLDPSKGLLKQFIDLNNEVLGRFSADERQKIGVHVCPGADHDSTHSADVPYSELIPLLMTMNAGNFYLQMASEREPEAALRVVADHLQDHQRIFVGVIDVNDERVESSAVVRDRVLMAARYLPVSQLGTCDDCGFSPFGDDIVTARDTAFAKITARVQGTQMARDQLA
ncbi:5-methyltetrahydropteroyltriglutamate--homocysteine methyltransferase [Brevifollis gellanilyticus]|uniref:5-methyltetrahydropteroyltriglutamate--homocysteine methyltransferase n=2 Tax=Brevifollis gellanilyticus TaxID=748831 RepID=A0A512M344_9BACT|nr:5-methyltetrahydropteroyltriglutamate--homocysteine methyltransferase [Brevifollis gellanilyticus]